MKHGKRYRQIAEKVDREKLYTLEEAVKIVKDTATAKFDETVETAVRLGIDPKKSDQIVRGSAMLPHGTGKTVKVLVFAEGDKAKEALDAGADYAGSDELIEKIAGGWFDFDVVIAVPAMMRKIGKLGRVLGTKGLMPNPKRGTVTEDVAGTVKAIKKGKISFRNDKTGIVHAIVGKASFEEDKIKENVIELVREIVRLKPSAAKGTYLRSITLSSTMGIGVKIDPKDIQSLMK
ncbi:50S ribosomal protein L1 [candidate division TA06 bacterium]|jgi:large subunit ribosomal protein L1|uniref:Large ribosomal subunit protein uL1 n=1 Tax=candidate division TA06 bacterium TaxID=2250710 RepID=A0A660S488_UNCT6|nr:MAG: 50S ribosomal protein L1 [candidate division TA06 bacterium]